MERSADSTPDDETAPKGTGANARGEDPACSSPRRTGQPCPRQITAAATASSAVSTPVDTERAHKKTGADERRNPPPKATQKASATAELGGCIGEKV